MKEFVAKFEKVSKIPREFSPTKGVYIGYTLNDLVWSGDRVILRAGATFMTDVSGKNVTYPTNGKLNFDPLKKRSWNATSPDDPKSHLLQGVRVSTEFMNRLVIANALS